jgi:uncharacterized DUF497 family protein
VSKPFEYQFEWDPIKAQQNAHKHRGITFERGASVFRDPHALSLYDADHSDQEERWVTLGIDETGVLLVVCHTYQGTGKMSARIRIISTRKATHREMSQYGGQKTYEERI